MGEGQGISISESQAACLTWAYGASPVTAAGLSQSSTPAENLTPASKCSLLLSWAATLRPWLNHQARLWRDCRSKATQYFLLSEKASALLSGNLLSHPLPSKSESKSVVLPAHPPTPHPPVSALICMVVVFFPFHLILASQLKNEGKMSKDWADSSQCLAKQESLLGQGSHSCMACPLETSLRAPRFSRLHLLTPE